jgi:hypothetical protein
VHVFAVEAQDLDQRFDAAVRKVLHSEEGAVGNVCKQNRNLLADEWVLMAQQIQHPRQSFYFRLFLDELWVKVLVKILVRYCG